MFKQHEIETTTRNLPDEKPLKAREKVGNVELLKLVGIIPRLCWEANHRK
jgi:hypothetical protein